MKKKILILSLSLIFCLTGCSPIYSGVNTKGNHVKTLNGNSVLDSEEMEATSENIFDYEEDNSEEFENVYEAEDETLSGAELLEEYYKNMDKEKEIFFDAKVKSIGENFTELEFDALPTYEGIDFSECGGSVHSVIVPKDVLEGEFVRVYFNGILNDSIPPLLDAYKMETLENFEDTYTFEDNKYVFNGETYDYKLKITGRGRNASKDSTFVVLTNNKDITFDEIFKSLISSNSNDFLTDTVIIGLN